MNNFFKMISIFLVMLCYAMLLCYVIFCDVPGPRGPGDPEGPQGPSSRTQKKVLIIVNTLKIVKFNIIQSIKYWLEIMIMLEAKLFY